jgi:hypothetical protein
MVQDAGPHCMDCIDLGHLTSGRPATCTLGASARQDRRRCATVRRSGSGSEELRSAGAAAACEPAAEGHRPSAHGACDRHPLRCGVGTRG